MARNIASDRDTTVYRAVIEKKYPGHALPHTDYEGPYLSEAVAKARVTFWKNHLGTNRMSNRWADGRVENGAVTWTGVDTDPQHPAE